MYFAFSVAQTVQKLQVFCFFWSMNGFTPCLSDLHQTKKVPAVLSMGFFEDNLLYCYITGIKIFRLALLKIFHFENFEFLYKKYLTTEKYFKDLRRCKIEFRTTFVFYTKLIFPLLFELESFEKKGKIFYSKYFLKFSKLSSSNRSGKINLV